MVHVHTDMFYWILGHQEEVKGGGETKIETAREKPAAEKSEVQVKKGKEEKKGTVVIWQGTTYWGNDINQQWNQYNVSSSQAVC